MGIVSLPARGMDTKDKSSSCCKSELTSNRFEEILSLLHSDDNELMNNRGEPGYDRLQKVRSLMNIISESFENCVEPELVVVVDEQIVPLMGRDSLKVYMKNKPKKWG